MIREVRFFDSGYCRQLLGLVDRRTWRIVRFQAVFVAARHSTHGWVLIDTGYGARFRWASRQWPYRLYRWLTPVVEGRSTPDILRAAGIDPAEIRHLILTHFHADHIGGLADFPSARLHYHERALASLIELSPWRRTAAAFLPALVPADTSGRAGAVPQSSFTPSSELPFGVCDLFGDRSIQLVDLPGHAPGHLGVLIADQPQRLLYAADAYWRSRQVTEDLDPTPIAMWFQWDRPAYQDTIQRLRTVRASEKFRMVTCHGEEAQRLITRSR